MTCASVVTHRGPSALTAAQPGTLDAAFVRRGSGHAGLFRFIWTHSSGGIYFDVIAQIPDAKASGCVVPHWVVSSGSGAGVVFYPHAFVRLACEQPARRVRHLRIADGSFLSACNRDAYGVKLCGLSAAMALAFFWHSAVDGCRNGLCSSRLCD